MPEARETPIPVICNCCEKQTLEPIYHDGDAYCGACVASLLSAERDRYREALEFARDFKPVSHSSRLDALDRYCREVRRRATVALELEHVNAA